MRLLRYTSILIFAISILLGTAIWIGRQQPLPERLAMLNIDKCAPPCWIGIVPGKTTLDEAERNIKAVYAQPLYKITAQARTGFYTIKKQSWPKETFTISLSHDRSQILQVVVLHIEQIMFEDYIWRPNPTGTHLSVGEIMKLVGLPQALLVFQEGGFCKTGFDVFYKHETTYISPSRPAKIASDCQLLPTQTVQTIVFVPNSETFASWVERPWRGFSTLRKYYVR